MSIYTTPLQFGYFLALAMTILFWIRSIKESRLSDFFLGLFMLLLALEIQDYTFGFAGINILWDEFNGIYRNVEFLVWPTLYFYFKTQTDTSYRFKNKDLLHFAPWSIFFLVHLIVFFRGKYAVQEFQESELFEVLSKVHLAVKFIIFLFYAYQIRRIYFQYKTWYKNQFSNSDKINFIWFRNLLYVLILGFGFQTIMIQLDKIYEWDFYQDWWWNLAIVGIIFFVGLEGYAQYQPAKILMIDSDLDQNEDSQHKTINKGLLDKLSTLIRSEKPYLNPEITLSQLAKKLQTNSSELSFLINKSFEKNFNDYINSLRVDEFIRLSELEENKNYTIEAIAFDSGFNSKSTFNRAFKKATGKSPSHYFGRYDVKTK